MPPAVSGDSEPSRCGAVGYFPGQAAKRRGSAAQYQFPLCPALAASGFRLGAKRRPGERLPGAPDRRRYASRPVSRVRYGARESRARDGHSSWTAVAGRLKQPTRATVRRRTCGSRELRAPLFGLAPGGACHAAHVAMGAVRSYRTVSPLPTRGRRSLLCGAFPGVAPAGHYPAPCLRGARTFLRLSGGRPADWQRPA